MSTSCLKGIKLTSSRPAIDEIDTACSSEVIGLPASFGVELLVDYPFNCYRGLPFKKTLQQSVSASLETCSALRRKKQKLFPKPSDGEKP